MVCKKEKKKKDLTDNIVRNIIGDDLKILDEVDYDTDRLRIKG